MLYKKRKKCYQLLNLPHFPYCLWSGGYNVMTLYHTVDTIRFKNILRARILIVDISWIYMLHVVSPFPQESKNQISNMHLTKNRNGKKKLNKKQDCDALRLSRPYMRHFESWLSTTETLTIVVFFRYNGWLDMKQTCGI